MEEEKKLNFHSESLQKIIDKYIKGRIEYKGFEVVLSEIFQRRAAEFDYTDEEMEKQLETFTSNVKFLCFKPNVFLAKSSAHYHPAMSTIVFNQDTFEYLKQASIDNPKFDCGEMMFEIFTHEVYHAISYKSQYEIGLAKKRMFGVVDQTINEAFTETAASRTVYNRSEDNYRVYYKKASGYQDIVFVPELIASIIGETEKNVLKAGMAGSKELEELILSKYPKSLHKEVKNGFNKFKFYLDEYHKIYSMSLEKISERDKEILEKSICEMENVSQELFFHQVKNDPRACTEKFAGEVNHRMNFILHPFSQMAIECEENEIFDKNVWHRYNENTISKRKRTLDMKRDIERIAFIRDGISDQNVLNMLDECAKDGSLDDKADFIKEKYGIDVKALDEYRDRLIAEKQEYYILPNFNDYENKIKREDYHDFNVWDNSFESIETMRVLNKKSKSFNIYKACGAILNGIKKVSKGVNKFFNKMFGLEEKMLSSGENKNNEGDKKKSQTFDEEIRVDTSKINFKVITINDRENLSVDKSR